MTERKHFKQLVRGRMAKTGESYSAARRQVLKTSPASKRFPHHYPGSIPSATALRALLSHAGVINPETNAPLSEAMVFGIMGGLGAGMFAFHYAKAGFSTFFLAGRHLWFEDFAWADLALKRIGARFTAKESSGLKPAEKNLRDLLDGGRPALTWLDAACLPHRGMPEAFRGSAYHVATVHGVEGDSAFLGDQGEAPATLPLTTLAAARASIRKYRNRVLAIDSVPKRLDLPAAVRGGIEACVGGLTKARMKNFSLDAFATWADRLHGSKAADSWEKLFPPGPLLFRGLWSVYECIEHFGTGGGLCRPMFADFLEEAASELDDRGLARAAAHYSELGKQWTSIAAAALPESTPALHATRNLLDRTIELAQDAEPGALDELLACRRRLGEGADVARLTFPLSEAASANLRGELQSMVRAVVEAERAGLKSLGAWLEEH